MTSGTVANLLKPHSQEQAADVLPFRAPTSSIQTARIEHLLEIVVDTPCSSESASQGFLGRYFFLRHAFPRNVVRLMKDINYIYLIKTYYVLLRLM